jgi:effector-binding domain-containing protein
VTLSDLQQIVGTSAKELFGQALKNDLFISGPIYWIYYGMDGNPDTVFNLDVALPVNGNSSSATEHHIKELDPFYCLSTIHEGAWDTLPGTYAGLMERVHADKLHLSGITRELYTNIDFNHPENNITEVQLGILR